MAPEGPFRQHYPLAKRKALLRSHMATGLHVDIPEPCTPGSLPSWDHAASSPSSRLPHSPTTSPCTPLPHLEGLAESKGGGAQGWPSARFALGGTLGEVDCNEGNPGSWSPRWEDAAAPGYRLPLVELPGYDSGPGVRGMTGLKRRLKLPVHRRISVGFTLHLPPYNTYGGQCTRADNASSGKGMVRKAGAQLNLTLTGDCPTVREKAVPPETAVPGMCTEHGGVGLCMGEGLPDGGDTKEGMGEVEEDHLGSLQPAFTTAELQSVAHELLREVCRCPTPPRGRQGRRPRVRQRRKRQALGLGTYGGRLEPRLAALGPGGGEGPPPGGVAGLGKPRLGLGMPAGKPLMPLPFGGVLELAMKLRAFESQLNADYKQYSAAEREIAAQFNSALQRCGASEAYMKPVQSSVSLSYRRILDTINQHLADLAL